MTTCIVCGGSEITRTLSPISVGQKKEFFAEVRCDKCRFSSVAVNEAMDVAIDQAADAFERGPVVESETEERK